MVKIRLQASDAAQGRGFKWSTLCLLLLHATIENLIHRHYFIFTAYIIHLLLLLTSNHY